VRDFDEGDDDDDDDDDVLRCERIFLRIFAFVIHFSSRKTNHRTHFSQTTDDDDTQHVPGVLSSSSRGENGIIIINIIIIASSFLAGLSSASFSDEKK